MVREVKGYIDLELKPEKCNFYDKTRNDCIEPKTKYDILVSLGIEKVDYDYPLSISDDQDFQVLLKQLPNSCFVQNYSRSGLLAWEANTYSQPVFNNTRQLPICVHVSQKQKMNVPMLCVRQFKSPWR